MNTMHMYKSSRQNDNQRPAIPSHMADVKRIDLAKRIKEPSSHPNPQLKAHHPPPPERHKRLLFHRVPSTVYHCLLSADRWTSYGCSHY